MNKLNYITWLLLFFWIFSVVYSFSIDEIEQSIDSDFLIDFKWDKVDYNFSKQNQIKKDNNWWYINASRDSYIDSDNNLNLDNIDHNDVEDNSQQWESNEEFNWSVIPINYFENKQIDIINNIIKKKTSFRMEFYERGSIKVKNNLQIYYNPDLKNVLLWWVPSTFWFWNWSVSIEANNLLDLWAWNTNIINSSTNCSISCNCGDFYSVFWQCYNVPNNWYSIGNDFQCLTWYKKDSSWESCIQDWTQNNEIVPISDSPFEWIRYNWIEPIDNSDDPFWISIIEWPIYTPSTSNLWIQDYPYNYSTSDIINEFNPTNYLDIINKSNEVYCISTYLNYYLPSLCNIKQSSSIYDIPLTPIK